MMYKNRIKTMLRSSKGYRSVLALLVALPALVACANPIAKAVESIRADVVSPRITITQSDSTAITSGGTLDYGQSVYGSSVDVSLTIKNEGKSALLFDTNSIAVAMGTGTEPGSFKVVTNPSSSIAVGSSSSMVLRFCPATEGIKKATLNITTNDTSNAIFRIVLEGTGALILMSAKVDSVTTNTASISANVALASGLSLTARGLCWGPSPAPTIDGGLLSSGAAAGSFQELVTSLSTGTIYYVRPYITREGSTSYGPQISFITLTDAPSMPTVSVVGYPAGSGKLSLSWSAVTGASIYEIYYSTTGNFPSGQTPYTTTGTTYAVDGLADFSPCYFWIKARNVSGVSLASPSGSGEPGVHITGIALDKANVTTTMGLDEQLNATVSPADATYPTVSWSSSDETVVKVSSSGLVSAVGAGTTTITAKSSATAAGNICKSATCTFNVIPAAPTAISARTANGGEVTLNWSSVAGATSYNVYHSLTSGAGTGGTKVSGILDTSYTVSGLTNWSNCYFVVTAVGSVGESVASNQLSCMPIRQEIILVNKYSDSIDFNLFNAAAGSVTSPSGHEHIFGPNVAAADGAASVAIDPNARNAIYAAYTGTTTSLPGFYKYGYDATNGYAAATPYDYHCDGVGPEHLVVVTTPSGKKCLYVAFSAQAYLVMYDIDGNGNLSTIHTYTNARNDSARYLSADPSGKFLFASNFDASRITYYAIDSSTGHLTEVGYVGSGGTNPYRSMVTPDGKYLLVTNYGNANVVSFAISSGGALTQQSSISTSGQGPTGIAIDAAGKNVYVCSVKIRGNDANIGLGYLNHFALSGGNLVGASDWSNTFYGPTDLALDATGSRLIVLNMAHTNDASDGGALVYEVNSDGSITPKTGGSLAVSFGTGDWPTHLIVVKLP